MVDKRQAVRFAPKEIQIISRFLNLIDETCGVSFQDSSHTSFCTNFPTGSAVFERKIVSFLVDNFLTIVVKLCIVCTNCAFGV